MSEVSHVHAPPTEHDRPADELTSLRAELAAARAKIENLTFALASNRDIGVAIGILMALRRITKDEAFALLVATSQRTHQKVRDLAAIVSLTGTLPAPEHGLRMVGDAARTHG